jgi:hypothetical protein
VGFVLAAATFVVLAAGSPGHAVEQTLEVLAPAEEQEIEIVGAGRTGDVQGIESVDEQLVEPHEPPGPVRKVASTVGHAVLGVLAAGVSLGVMAASLLLL